MFLFFSKLLPNLVYPLGLACLLILIAVIISRKQMLQRLLLIIAVLLLWIGGNRWVAAGLARSLEQLYTTPDPIPSMEVVVVLGGGTYPPEAPRSMVEVNGAGDRLIYAAQLHREGKAKYILVSGGLLDWEDRLTTPAEDMASLLIWMGVSPQAIWLQAESANTYEDALYSAQILNKKGIDRILLVTSAWHMPRAVRLFEAQGLQVIPLPTDYNVTQQNWDQMLTGEPRTILLDLLPNASHLSLTTRMLKEYLGLWIYKLRGWTG
jgi:uncharacterized SAM-binding protein YcdF (DUF218 family)